MMKKLFLVMPLFFLSCLSHATEPNTFVATITGFNSPYAIAITPSGLYAYVTDGSSIRVIDTDQTSPTFNTIIAAPALEGIITDAPNLAATPNGLFVYVVDSESNSVLVIDSNPSSPTFNTRIAASALSGTFSSPNGVAITPDSTRAYVTNSVDLSVNVIDIDPASPSFNTILTTPGLDSILISPFEIAITTDGLYAYVTNLNGTVNVIDTNPASPTYNTLLPSPGLDSVNPQPEGFAITFDSLAAYVTDAPGNSVTVLDINPASPTYNTVVSAPNLANAFNSPNDVATTAVGNYAYVTNFLGSNGDISSVVVIDTNPASPTYNTTIATPGLNQGSMINRYFTLAANPNARYVYAVDGYNLVVMVIYTGILIPPLNFAGCGSNNIFLFQKEFSNVLTWSAPTLGALPTSYKIYSDAGLTNLIATVPATGPLEYKVHNLNPNVPATYYIVSADDYGNISSAAHTTVTSACAQ